MNTPKKLTAKQERVINTLIESHHTMDAEFVVYEAGWNDRVVAAEARKLCEHPEIMTDNAVANHRRQAFGNFRRENHKAGDTITSRSRITHLQNEVGALRERVSLYGQEMAALTARVEELEQKQLKLFASPAEPRRSNNVPGASR
jgi:hypothetical protein